MKLRFLQISICAAVLFGLCSCATHLAQVETKRPFNFQTDTFTFSNELVWEYYFDDHRKWTSRPREPEPDYSHHCFVVARSACQFFEHARFNPTLPVADEMTYRRLVSRVVSKSPGYATPDSEKIVIPGYANLHEFSAAHESLLKTQCGGAWQSYFQHGHWRMLMPFSRHHQEKMAKQFVEDLKNDHPPVAHIVRFPQLTINHAIVLFDKTETTNEIRFAVYDPNNPSAPTTLTYDRKERTFFFPSNNYFYGGRVDVYEVYRNLLY